jgi:hypothetical protein
MFTVPSEPWMEGITSLDAHNLLDHATSLYILKQYHSVCPFRCKLHVACVDVRGKRSNWQCWSIRGLLEKYPTVFFYANT